MPAKVLAIAPPPLLMTVIMDDSPEPSATPEPRQTLHRLLPDILMVFLIEVPDQQFHDLVVAIREPLVDRIVDMPLLLHLLAERFHKLRDELERHPPEDQSGRA